ncbi:tRNA dihydrouridine synthase [Sneathiella sp.]|jgi:tRNA-dihydrouridine synthase C|uniref:tRNA dihydrouridine synthase n=1 Tax=Sneathiella sp. TaxID=1964365 RepID=UPI0039E37BED
MTLTLAPMEGVVDVHMRDILTRIGGFDLCVSEFVRVSNHVLPASVYHQYCPELKSGGKTAAGVPVHVQLMGGDPSLLAENAAFVAELGAPGIDINFGCPAKTVNRNDAGATLLQWPHRLNDIVSAVRRAVPAAIPVSAKMRLGFMDKSLYMENAQAIQSGGAMKLTVHARTKLEGYKAPAHWEYLAPLRESLTIPLVANGEIWTRQDYEACKKISGCTHFMVGRGAIARPSLALEIAGLEQAPFHWAHVQKWLVYYRDLIRVMDHDTREAGRLKQWIKLLARSYDEATDLFTEIRRLKTPDEICAALTIPV